MYKIVIYLPIESFEIIQAELFKLDIGNIGNYKNCMSWSMVKACFTPNVSSHPYVGEQGVTEICEEIKLEIQCEEAKLEESIRAIRRVHPYEEACIEVYPMLDSIY